jgi:2,3-bisphosphoglycerate-independent phosphoglycerate mutase
VVSERPITEHTAHERATSEHAAHDRAISEHAVDERAIDGRTVDVLVILDGASEPVGVAPTSLERARTPALDGLVAEGGMIRLRTVAPGLPTGSESAIPALLGWVPSGPVDRGAIEAAAHGIEVRDGERAWRVDRRDRGDAAAAARALEKRLGARHSTADHRVHHLAGHRMLLVAPGPARTLGAELLGVELRSGVLRAGLLGARALGAEMPRAGAPRDDLLVWPAGAMPPRILDARTVVIGARGAATGIARLMGARTVVPPCATGRPGTDLAAKAAAALEAIDAGATRVVVHVGAPDEAAHERDAAAKVAAIEAADEQLLAPLANALRARRAELGDGAATLQVCPDHGCDPATGRHDDAPVPCLRWPFARVDDAPAPNDDRPFERAPGTRGQRERLTERAVADLPVTDIGSFTPGAAGERGRAVPA